MIAIILHKNIIKWTFINFKGLPWCAYSTSEDVLEFYNTVVGDKHSVELLIENKGLVTAVVQLNIEKIKQKVDENTKILEENVFTLLSPAEMYIQPYSTEAFIIQFAPNSLQVCYMK